METQTVLGNYITQFCCVQNVQQRTQHGSLWDAESYDLMALYKSVYYYYYYYYYY